MKELKFRCSSLGQLMTNDRSGKAMGETAKTLVRETWIGYKYGRWPAVRSKYLTKGIMSEEDSLTLYTQHTGQIYVKNETNFKNDWITGTPDIVDGDTVIDIKSPFDIWTFSKSEMTKDYEWQLRGYMMLTGAKNATLAYCLSDMPASMLSHELYMAQFDFAGGEADEAYQRHADQVSKNYTYADIPVSDRVKVFHLERDLDLEQKLIERVKEAREYAETLSL